jgi:MFS family permease
VRWPRGLAALRERDYLLYFIGHSTSATGNWIEQTAVSWILYELTGSALLLGIGGLCRAGPVLALTVLGGAVADHLPRRPVLLTTESILLVISLAVGLLAADGRLAFWDLYLLNLASGTLAAFSVPARQALFPGLVARQTMTSAVTLNAVAVRSAGLIGPSIAGVALATSGYAAPFLLNALSFVGMLVALAVMRPSTTPEPTVACRPSLREDMAAGLQFVWRQPVLRVLLALEIFSGLFGHNPALITIIARDVLGIGPEGLGVLLSALAVGSLLGMLLLVVFHTEQRGRLILVAGAAYVVLLVGFGLSRSLPLSALLLVMVGASDGVWSVTRNTVAQLVVPDALRGRVMSIVVLVTRGFTPLGHVQSGAVAAVAGGPAAAGLGAAVIGLSRLAAALRGPELRRFDGHPATPPQPSG